MKKFPEIVFFKTTSKCNHNCRYCYDSKKHADMGLEEVKKMVKLFFEREVKGIVLSGGEPLLREDFSEILSELKKYKLKVYLDTNGDFWEKYKGEINSNVEILGLPLDYSSEEQSFRDKINFHNILAILEYYKTNPGPKIRIGTVVTKANITELEKIGNLLKKYKIYSWKIYQFIPIGPNAISNEQELLISSEDLENATKNLEKEYKEFFNIIISPRKSRASAYFFISSDGTVFMPRDDMEYRGDEDIGNIFDNDIVEKWEKAVNKRNYISNVERTLGYKFNR